MLLFFNGSMEMLQKISTWSTAEDLRSPAGEIFNIAFRGISKNKIKLFVLTSVGFLCGRTTFPCIKSVLMRQRMQQTNLGRKVPLRSAIFSKDYKRSVPTNLEGKKMLLLFSAIKSTLQRLLVTVYEHSLSVHI